MVGTLRRAGIGRGGVVVVVVGGDGVLNTFSSKPLGTVAREPSTTESSRMSGRDTDTTRLERRRRNDSIRPIGDLTVSIARTVLCYSTKDS